MKQILGEGVTAIQWDGKKRAFTEIETLLPEGYKVKRNKEKVLCAIQKDGDDSVSVAFPGQWIVVDDRDKSAFVSSDNAIEKIKKANMTGRLEFPLTALEVYKLEGIEERSVMVTVKYFANRWRVCKKKVRMDSEAYVLSCREVDEEYAKKLLLCQYSMKDLEFAGLSGLFE